MNLNNQSLLNKSLLILIALSIFVASPIVAQEEEEEPSLDISGTVDTYYKFNFADDSQVSSSFATDHNSWSVGMVNVIFSQEWEKVSFVGDVAFGPRATQSAGNPIQNLYVSYDISDELSVTGGFMGTFIGYEIISPAGNFNYSTSYMFSNGPFQNAGLKFDYSFSENFALMAGLFNQYDSYTWEGPSDFGAQMYAGGGGLDAYLNFATGAGTPGDGASFNQIDLTATFQATEDFLLGLNATQFTSVMENTENMAWSGAAVYLNYFLSEGFGLGLRGEYFNDGDNLAGIYAWPDPTEGGNVLDLTLSANINAGPLTFIPEFRIDSASEDVFTDADGGATGSSAFFLMAAYYSF